ncbi:CheR family methyltransferase [Sphingomonas corticis]|jgi:two-component system CheB/CheR fusion protein|uniref:protein-glutamate O-methyltransferase n=1 Tax=Sphingomonas corticis TaxID=2722791 RepID=A0ABX1CR14_9SPHN|nr:CheR family methyltransferase [Sphingomonas corticis]NJR80384.1 PAS domain S-box protein [Sphingomonas corticis]
MAEKSVPEPQFEDLLRYIQESRGLDFRGYKRTSLRRRIAIRMEAVGVEDFAAYQAHLEVHPGEFEDLLNTVLINVTSFFRDPDAWEVLKTDVVPEIVATAGDQRAIRVWSVGCASGEEPYSIAMLFAEALGLQTFCERVKIYATDLDEEALKTARAATYTARDVEGVPPDLLDRYFERTNHHYVFNREVRRCVIFGQHNVVRDAPISRIDLLVCRNLLIYLESETQDVVLPRLHYALAPDGFLFLGKAETQLARSALFRPVEMRHRIFAKVPQEWRRTAGNTLPVARADRGDAPPQMLLAETVLNEAGTAYLVIDEAGKVALANAAARQLVSVGEADIGRPFQDLPISYRPLELRAPIEQAMRERRVIRLEHQEYHQSPAETIRLTIELRPLFHPQDGSVYASLLSFTNTTQIHAMQRELEAAQESLEQSIEELQSANEELETTNEELQSTNEELETTNEELQSTNEELETINEEARSSNEEMESTNEELRLQAEQAVSYKTYLESVLRSMNVGVVVIDAAHVVRSWNRWSENAWGLRAEEVVGTAFDALDIGFPVHLLRGDLLTVQSGREAAEQVLEGVDRRGRPILCRVRVAPLSAEDAGMVIAFEDITEERRREDYTRYLGRIMGQALNEIYFLDPDTLHFTLSNRGAEKKLGCTATQLTQMTLADVMPSVGMDELKRLFEPLIAGEKPEIVVETVIRAVDGREYPAEICVQYYGEEVPRILVAVVHDTSDRQQLPAA